MKVSVPTVGELTVDIAFGGMWYVIANIDQVGLDIRPEEGARLARLGEMVKVATRAQCPVVHPTMDYPGPDILVWTQGTGLSRRNTVVMTCGDLDTATGMLDRSPCGSGTAAVMALMYDKGELELGQTFTHQSVLGTVFTGHLVDTVQVSDQVTGVTPVICGRGWVTGVADVIIEADDPLPTGYTVADIW